MEGAFIVIAMWIVGITVFRLGRVQGHKDVEANLAITLDEPYSFVKLGDRWVAVVDADAYKRLGVELRNERR